MTAREQEEYRALRQTIATRGTARVAVFLGGMTAWGGLLIATAATMSLPVATLLPLLLLAATFEAVFALHVGVERIGRYLSVFHEARDRDSAARWEHVIGEFAPSAAKGGPDPLFVRPFLLATLANIVPIALAGAIYVEWMVVGVVHVLFVWHVVRSKRYASAQRALDQKGFERIRDAHATGATAATPTGI